MNTLIKFATAGLAIALLAGCATARQISDSNRDTSGAYDGAWLGTFQRTASKQQGPGNWELSCNDRQGAVIGLAVKEGRIATYNNDNEVRAITNINKKGQFRLEISTEYQATASGRSDVSINNGDITYILIGNLGKSSPSGKFTVGIKELGNAGCTTSVEFKRATGSEQSS